MKELGACEKSRNTNPVTQSHTTRPEPSTKWSWKYPMSNLMPFSILSCDFISLRQIYCGGKFLELAAAMVIIQVEGLGHIHGEVKETGDHQLCSL